MKSIKVPALLVDTAIGLSQVGDVLTQTPKMWVVKLLKVPVVVIEPANVV